MDAKQLTLKCFAKQTQGDWVAVCLDFNLATQGETLEEAKQKLEEQIYFYVDEALQDKQYGAQLLDRKAPLSLWVEYGYIWLMQAFFHPSDSLFKEILPLRMA